ncbi:MAG TPA: hypothetical protein VFF80_05050 [Bacillota bacterium]|nr:hypothetical protein [Bacillota bacterium]
MNKRFKSKGMTFVILAIALLDRMDYGSRSFGMETYRIHSGTYSNQVYGKYSLQAYRCVSPVIVVH